MYRYMWNPKSYCDGFLRTAKQNTIHEIVMSVTDTLHQQFDLVAALRFIVAWLDNTSFKLHMYVSLDEYYPLPSLNIPLDALTQRFIVWKLLIIILSHFTFR